MRDASFLTLLLLASVSLSAQDGALRVMAIPMVPATSDQTGDFKSVKAILPVHDIPLCQGYQHYLHEIPLGKKSPFLSDRAEDAARPVREKKRVVRLR